MSHRRCLPIWTGGRAPQVSTFILFWDFHALLNIFCNITNITESLEHYHRPFNCICGSLRWGNWIATKGEGRGRGESRQCERRSGVPSVFQFLVTSLITWAASAPKDDAIFNAVCQRFTGAVTVRPILNSSSGRCAVDRPCNWQDYHQECSMATDPARDEVMHLSA